MKPAGFSANCVQASSVTQVVSAASRDGSQVAGRRSPQRRSRGLPVSGAGRRGARRARGRTRAAPGRPELLPDRRQRVLRARGDRAPAVRRRASAVCWAVPMAPGGSTPRAQAGTSSATAIALAARVPHPGEHGQVVLVDVAEHRDQQARSGRPRCSQPVSMRGWVGLGQHGQRLEQRARSRRRRAVLVPGAAVVRRPAAVTSRTLKPRCTRCTAIDAAAETAGSREDAMPCAAVGAHAGCRGTGWPGTARAAPRGAPSARRRARCCASARGAGRRRGGTRGR